MMNKEQKDIIEKTYEVNFKPLTNDDLVCKDCNYNDAKIPIFTGKCEKYEIKPSKVLNGGECEEYKKK